MGSFASFYWDVVDKNEVQDELSKLLTHAMEFLGTMQSNDELVAYYQPPVMADGQQFMIR